MRDTWTFIGDISPRFSFVYIEIGTRPRENEKHMSPVKWLHRHLYIPLALIILPVVLDVFFIDLPYETLYQALPSCLGNVVNRLTNLDGAKSTITAIGTVCFALTYINTARSLRVRGILLEDVLRSVYPHYGTVFVFHGCFAVLGQYSCAVKSRGSAGLCLLGIVVCLVYTLRMAVHVYFSPSLSAKMVNSFLEDEATKMTPEASIFLPCQVGKYIAEITSKNNAEPFCVPTKRKTSIGTLFVSLTLASVHQTGKDSTFPEAFSCIFASSENKSMQRPLHILCALPHYATCMSEFQTDISRLGLIWESLLFPVESVWKQAELTYGVLHTAKTDSTVLCCGLIYYLHETYLSCLRNVGEDGWLSCARFISEILYKANTASMQNGKVSRYEVDKKVYFCCRDMSITFLCLSYLEQANTKRQIDVSSFRTLTLNELNTCGIDIFTFWNEDLLEKYLCYAYNIFFALGSKETEPPSRQDMYLQTPVIIHAIKQILASQEKDREETFP